MSGRTEVSCDPLERAPVVGIVGAGQLARMLCEAASALGIGVVVMAERLADAATPAAAAIIEGSPRSALDMDALAARCDVITFDHELVDLGIVGDLEGAGVPVRPSVRALEVAVDKSVMRSRLAAAGLPVPPFVDLGSLPVDQVRRALDDFAARQGWPLVLKAARGGYDGRGVWVVGDAADAGEVLSIAAASGTALLVEAHVDIDAELAVLVATGPDGQVVSWPSVETTQVSGVCREVLMHADPGPDLTDRATTLGRAVAREVGSVGILAIELFATGTGLLVNEVAARPHNSGHWTIEGSVTSQFENHLRAVLGLPLGSTKPCTPEVASVNVFGAAGGEDPAVLLPGALAIEGAHVHLYGKETRPGRKLGHVTVCGTDAVQVRGRAWAAARALGTEVPAGLELAAGTRR